MSKKIQIQKSKQALVLGSCSVCLIFLAMLAVLSSPVYAAEKEPAYYNNLPQFIADATSPLRMVRRQAMSRMFDSAMTSDYWSYKEFYDSVMPYIVECLYDEDYWTRMNAANAFSDLCKGDNYLYPNLGAELCNPLDDMVAIILLGSFTGPYGEGSEFTSDIVVWLESDNEHVRSATVHALTQFLGGLNDESVISWLESALDDPSEYVVIEAISALISVGQNSPLLKAKLEKLSQSENERLAAHAKELLAELE